MLDPALVRPGRFDRIIYVGAPDFEGRIEVLKVSARALPASLIPAASPWSPLHDHSQPHSMRVSCWDACTAWLGFACLHNPASTCEQNSWVGRADHSRNLREQWHPESSEASSSICLPCYAVSKVLA